MNMIDVNETAQPTNRQEALKSAIPDHVKRNADAEEINQMIQKETAKHTSAPSITPDELSKFLQITNLPSKYLRYPEGSILYGKPLDVPQLKKMSTMTPDTASTIIDDILKSATRGIPIEEIMISDKLYILLWLRANTYPESGYSIPFVCSSCEKQSTYDFKVDDIDINYIRDDINFEEPLELSTGDFVVFKYPRVKDEIRIQRFKDSVRKAYSKYDDDTLSMVTAINSVNGKNMTVMETHDFLNNTKIYSQIKGYISDFNFGISSVLNVKCNSCGGQTQTGITFREEFTIPSYQFAKSSRNGVSNK